MPSSLEFDDRAARTYRKTAEVLAFRSSDPFQFEKAWGHQECREGSWLIVPIDKEGTPTGDAYGCDAAVFDETYASSPSMRPNRFRKTANVRAYQPGELFQVATQLADGHDETPVAVSLSKDAWAVKGPGGEIYPVENEVFKGSYEQVVESSDGYRIKSQHEHWSADARPKRILALDGGGVRGILTIGYLERIEEILKERHGGRDGFRLCHYFDLIAGTSTGAIIAALLAMGKSAAEVRSLYEKLAEDVFRRSFFRRGVLRAKFSPARLRGHLEGVFGENTLGSPELLTGLLVVTKRLDTGSAWPLSNNPFGQYFNGRPGAQSTPNKDYLLRAVVRASTAAPSFFAPESIEIQRTGKAVARGMFVDGGVSPHNNPTLQALQLVALKGFGVNWTLDPSQLLVVSAGTGAATPDVARNRTAAKHAISALQSLMNDCSDGVETLMQWLSNSPTARTIDRDLGSLSNDLLAERPLVEYLRYNVQLQSKWIADELGQEVSAKELAQIAQLDNPKGMARLSKLGADSATNHVDPSHFPPRFDLEP